MLPCMRTTLDINDRLMAEAKSLAARRGLSLKALVEEALREIRFAEAGLKQHSKNYGADISTIIRMIEAGEL